VNPQEVKQPAGKNDFSAAAHLGHGHAAVDRKQNGGHAGHAGPDDDQVNRR
jgi:hypothetical protein